MNTTIKASMDTGNPKSNNPRNMSDTPSKIHNRLVFQARKYKPSTQHSPVTEQKGLPISANQPRTDIPQKKNAPNINQSIEIISSPGANHFHPIRYTPKQGEFDTGTALTFSHFCLLSYSKPEVIESGLQKNGLKTFRYLGVNDPWPKAVIAANDRYISVCFRGTKSSWDWLTNIELVQEPIVTNGRGKVHKGIQRATLRRYNEISEIVEKLQKQNPRPVYLTGHSLGGGMAILTAAMLHHDKLTPEAVYTFGSPKIGDAQFAKEYALYPKLHQNTFRIVNYCDLVTKIPHTDNFVHVSEEHERLFTPDGRMLVGASLQMPSAEGPIGLLQSYGSSCPINFEIVNSHFMELYIHNLDQSFKKQKYRGIPFLRSRIERPKVSKAMGMEL